MGLAPIGAGSPGLNGGGDDAAVPPKFLIMQALKLTTKVHLIQREPARLARVVTLRKQWVKQDWISHYIVNIYQVSVKMRWL